MRVTRSIRFSILAVLALWCHPLAVPAADGKPDTAWKIDFGAGETAKGYVAVDHAAPFDAAKGFGWVKAGGILRDRQAPDALNRDYIFGREPATFRVRLAPGLYRVTITSGDMLYDDHFTRVRFSSGGKDIPTDCPVLHPATAEFITLTTTIQTTGDTLDILIDSPSNNWVLNSLAIEPAAKAEKTQTSSGKAKPEGQKVCLSETDPASPRRAALKSDSPDEEIIRNDVDNDGDPDILERWWNGKRVRWFDENDDMLASDRHGDTVDDSLQIDRDADGYYDGPDDMNVDWVDNDNDGDPDLQVVAMNPSHEQATIYAGASHYMIFEDNDDDNVLGYIDWKTFDFPCWRTTDGPNFSPDYNGDAIFLKDHQPPWAISDPRYSWENPFAFYDFDNDGCTEMAIRYIDNRIQDSDSESHFDGIVEQVMFAYDLDNDSQRKNEMDYDMSMLFDGGEMIDYKKEVHKFPKLKAPEWVLPYFRYTNWRVIDELIYMPHEKCYDEMFKPKWGKAFFNFDEDDDDHRWERVELYFPDDPYIVTRWGEGKGRGLPGHPQSDTLGDRGEFDLDYSGGGKLYIGAWDGKIHLHGAEWGAWLVDYGAHYWGSGPVVGDSSPARAKRVEEVVQYRDTDNNGFFDEVTYDYDGDKEVDLRVSLLDYATDKNPHPDVRDVISPDDAKWKGMHELFLRITAQAWDEAQVVYRAAWDKGLSTPELDDLAISASTNERYEHAYWLKEKVLRAVLAQVSGDEKKEPLKLHFTGDFAGFANYIRSREWKGKEQMLESEYIKTRMKEAFRYMIAHPIEHPDAGWERAALYTGICAAYDATGDEEYVNQAIKWGEGTGWKFNVDRRGVWNADNQACGWTYLRCFQARGGDEKIAETKAIIDEMIAKPPAGRVEWWWCDALFMAPPVFVRLANVTGQAKYIDLMNEMWFDSTDFLYDKEEHLYYRDKNFFDKRSANGKKVFWSRGNGWVMGGYARVLQELPKDNPRRDDYIKIYREMAAKLLSVQQPDGLWRMSLIDPEEFPTRESSGSGFFCYSLAWGVNNGILDRATYEPAVIKAWEALVENLSPSGKLCWVQPVGASPYAISRADTHEYGVGAFLLAGSEVMKLKKK